MKFTAEATVRKESGKGAARQIRRTGKIPAVMYGQGESRMLTLEPGAVRKILVAQAGSTGLIALRIMDGSGEMQRTAVIQDYQVDPILGSLLHVDLLEVAMDKVVRVKVQVHITGSVPIGVKVEKGVLHQPLREFAHRMFTECYSRSYRYRCLAVRHWAGDTRAGCATGRGHQNSR